MEKDIFQKAHDLWINEFNSLPFEKRKMLPDIYIRWQETKRLLKLQSEVMSNLQKRELFLRQELIKWFKENSNE